MIPSFSNYKDMAERVTEWCHRYLNSLRDRPVRSASQPGDILRQIDSTPPENPVPMDSILDDFERIVPAGMTHWQHPRFFAYFPANASAASMLAEQLVNAMAAQCMLWQTSPAATEIETRMVDWMRQAVGLPEHFRGVIQDSATTSTLTAVLTMRERALDWQGLEKGLSESPTLRVYCSEHVHSSVDKAVRLAGIGQDNLVKLPTNAQNSIEYAALENQIQQDQNDGLLPVGVVFCVGGTSIGANDDIASLIELCGQHDLYTHVDAAWAGSAMICPELRHIWDGVEQCDSIVFNPHKWLGVQFDCSLHFLTDPEIQIKTLGLRPAYLETPGQEAIVNYNEWTIPLGRRFRALKLWFHLRAYGLSDLRQRIRHHIEWAEEAAARIAGHPRLQIVTPCELSLFTFRVASASDDKTRTLLQHINDDGRTYLTQTTVDSRFVIRFQVGHFECQREDVMDAVDVIFELTNTL